MPVNYMDTDDRSNLLGHFIGQVSFSFWSTPEEEGKNNPDGPPDWKGADRYKLYWNVNVLDIIQDYDGEDVKSINKSFGIGKDPWYPLVTNPAHIRHKDDPGDELVEAGKARPILFKTTSGLGQFLALINGKIKVLETDRGPAEVMDEGGPLDVNLRPLGQYFRDNEVYDSRDADIWHNLIFEFRGIGLKYGDGKPRMTPYPVKWLPSFDGATALSTPAGRSTASDATPAYDWTQHGASEATAATLTALAARSTSHAEFAKQAGVLPAVKDDEVLMAAVMDDTIGNWGS